MVTYTAIPNSSIDVDSPITQDLMTLLRDNPIGIAEGAAGAPRMALSSRTGIVSGNTDFTGLDEFGGCEVLVFGDNGSGSSQNFNVALSDDGGSTFSTAATIQAVPTGDALNGVVQIDFTTGAYKSALHLGGTVPTTPSGTITTPAGTVNAIRFNFGGASGLAIMMKLNGGYSTT